MKNKNDEQNEHELFSKLKILIRDEIKNNLMEEIKQEVVKDLPK